MDDIDLNEFVWLVVEYCTTRCFDIGKESNRADNGIDRRLAAVAVAARWAPDD
jgi:hypothetical protein